MISTEEMLVAAGSELLGTEMAVVPEVTATRET